GRDGALGGADPQRHAILAVAERARGLAQACVAERFQGCVVEPLGLGDVANADREVIEHWCGLLCALSGTGPLWRSAPRKTWRKLLFSLSPLAGSGNHAARR